MMNEINAYQTRNIAGQSPLPKLNQQEIQKITQAYTKMFVALTYTNLLQGQTLGKSWFNAMQQMKSFVAAKDEHNAAAGQIKTVMDEHNKQLAKQMMTHPKRDQRAEIKPEHKKEIQAQISQNMNSGLKEMNQMIEKYQPMAEKMRAELAKLDAEKAKAGMKQAQTTPAPQTKKVEKFADAKQKITAAAMQKMQLQLLLQMKMQRQRAA